MIRKLLFLGIFILSALLYTGCHHSDQQELRIAVNPWVGYTPLYYADEMGWLEKAHIRLIHSTSLNETVQFYQASLIDGFASTQYEVSVLNPRNLVHLMTINRSNGGDVVLGNQSLEALVAHKDPINVYLEIDSVNKILFDKFVEKNRLQHLDFKLVNTPQSMIKEHELNDHEKAILITYEPYATVLRNRGFHQLGSTADASLLVLDSLYVNKDAVQRAPTIAKSLKENILRAYKALLNDPANYHAKINHYLENSSYEDFIQSLDTIEWLIDKPKSEIDKISAGHDIIPITGIQ